MEILALELFDTHSLLNTYHACQNAILFYPIVGILGEKFLETLRHPLL